MSQLNPKSILRIGGEQLVVVLAPNQHHHHIISFSASALPDHLVEAALHVDLVQEAEPPPINGGVELEFLPYT
tara:strand:+ start:1393 stop:1611 length:219 start_codon:yes stop_codon:yes gene_type:complete